MKTVIQFFISALVLVLIGYGVINIFDVEIVDLVDWIVGVATFMWLVAIVVVPWNAHFKAKEVLDEAEISKRKNILVIDSSMDYVKRVAKRSLFIAIGLHVFSAVVLYYIAAWGVSSVGYFGAGAAILLTAFRPTVRFYEYLQKRLGDIRREFRHPREDVRELLNTFQEMKSQIKELQAVLETDPKKPSWRQNMEKTNTTIFENIKDVKTLLEKHQAVTDKEFGLVKAESKQRYDKIVSDSQILESVRVLAGFVKELK